MIYWRFYQMNEETTIIINIRVPKDATGLIRAMRRAFGFFKSLVEKPEVIKK